MLDRLYTVLFTLLSLLFTPFVSATDKSITQPPITITNVIVMIPDGMSVSGTTLARLFKGQPLALDPLASGMMITWSGDGTIADSAPAGSAIATGWKSQSGNIASIGKHYAWPNTRHPKQGEALRPVATLLEAAKLSGRATGIVATSEFMHATPADFTAHDASRKNYDNLSEQMVYNHLDVILGGGIKYLKPESRADKEDLAAILRARGYTLVSNTAQLKQFSGSKLVGLFGKTDQHTALSYDLDRDPIREPSLAEMTHKAIEVLSKQPTGFFLLVEGSKVDWAAHANDPVGIVSEILAFDQAVNVAVDYAKRAGNTLVIAVADHANSGLSIGDRNTSNRYDKTPWHHFTAPLKRAKVTGEGFEALLPENWQQRDNPQIRSIIVNLAQQSLGIDNLTEQEIATILQAKSGAMNYAIGPIIAKRANLGFTTNGHTGEDTVLYRYDPRHQSLSGVVDNTEVAAFIAKAMQVDLDASTNYLFQDAVNAFTAKGATVREDRSDSENPVLEVIKGSQTLRIPRNKSIAWLNGVEVPSAGVTVYNGSRWFIASNLVEKIH
ncbi:alkaline phosphatase [Serratia microhaemolytica]|uniref:alkaline phosphatase n=1 Tax=Serratia microhaemolytica TaxID=2675110 RepID=UPI0013922D7B|nr:alkaline phosphatase [Serratia microhaemolytica]